MEQGVRIEAGETDERGTQKLERQEVAEAKGEGGKCLSPALGAPAFVRSLVRSAAEFAFVCREILLMGREDVCRRRWG